MRTTYRSNTYTPYLVSVCRDAAEMAGFAKSCTDDFGRLLYVLAGQANRRLLEIGTGFGVSTAWMISAMPEASRLVTVDSNEHQVQSVKALLDRDNVEFLCGDWQDALAQGPYDFIFADVKDAKQHNAEILFDSLAAGGLLVLDDLTPEQYWPDDWKGKPDPTRAYWLNHPKLAATELLLNEREAVILASRLE